jgi:hypothetical protein
MNSNEKPYAVLHEAHRQKDTQIQLVSFEISLQVIRTSGLSTSWFNIVMPILLHLALLQSFVKSLQTLKI